MGRGEASAIGLRGAREVRDAREKGEDEWEDDWEDE
jgi:hypothetical protein